MTSKPAPRVSWVILVVLLAALATGAAASILVTASTAPPPSSGATQLVYLPRSVIVAGVVGVAALVLGSLVYWGFTSSRNSGLTRVAVSILMVVFLGTLFVLGARVLGFGGVYLAGTGGSSSSGSNSTTNSTSTTGGNLYGPGGVLSFPSVPGWVPFAVLGIVVLLVVVVGVPQTRRYLAERREGGRMGRGPGTMVPAGMREALTRASADLDLGGDPRRVILALYAAMLEQLRPMVDDIGPSTPEEIRSAHLVRLGVRPEAARTLTRLFEEARYSVHSMGPPESVRAQEAVRATLDDLARRTFDE